MTGKVVFAEPTRLRPSYLLNRGKRASGVQIFNSPLLTFKSEIFIVLMNIAWTYLLHAHYRRQKVEYRYFKEKNGRRFFTKTKSGANKHWELAQCLDYSGSPIDSDTGNNLRFFDRDPSRDRTPDDVSSGQRAERKVSSLLPNYNQYLKDLFGDKYGIDRFLSLSLQFSAISQEQAETLPDADTMPPHIKAFVQGFEERPQG